MILAPINTLQTALPRHLLIYEHPTKSPGKFAPRLPKKCFFGLMLFLYTRRLPLFCKNTGSADLADPTAPDLTEVAILQLCAPTSTHRRPWCWVSSCVPFEIKSRNADEKASLLWHQLLLKLGFSHFHRCFAIVF